VGGNPHQLSHRTTLATFPIPVAHQLVSIYRPTSVGLFEKIAGSAAGLSDLSMAQTDGFEDSLAYGKSGDWLKQSCLYSMTSLHVFLISIAANELHQYRQGFQKQKQVQNIAQHPE